MVMLASITVHFLPSFPLAWCRRVSWLPVDAAAAAAAAITSSSSIAARLQRIERSI